MRHAPSGRPLLGHILKFVEPRHVLFDWFVQCQRRYGRETLQISIPTLASGVIVSDPVNLEFVLKNEHLISKGEFVKKRSRDLFGNGIINASGDLWKAQRKAGLKFFSGTNLETMVEDVLPQAWAKVREHLLTYAQEQSTFDMQACCLDYSSFIVASMAYDIDLDASHPFSKAFDYASDQIGRRFQNPVYPVTELLFGAKFRTALAVVHKFGRKIVATAKQDRAQKAFESLIDNHEPAFDTLLDSLMESLVDPSLVADAALNFLSAGKDTTAQSMTWTMYAIMRNSHVLEPIRTELQAKFKHHTREKGTINLTAADLQPNNLPFLMATYYEALRLFPPVPFEIQECQQDVELPDHTFLPKDSIVIWCIWAMNRSKELYGPDADDFKPQRWLNEAGHFHPRSAFEFPVFNGGPRACLGKKMAELMAMYLLIHVLLNFDISESSDSSDTSLQRTAQNSLTLPMAGGLPCRIRHETQIE